ncbi:FecR family protein [Pontibacter mucosus]|uniref:FecR family protein n=1 Tax=Pontibacter mucosus TaxID=1649266 RepID=A0A2T5YG05_9BACT|nr:FecR domain-containing protein [Pontibacter mucosus]PTX18228.1 FecR family protein [Pontibacter mucosus]
MGTTSDTEKAKALLRRYLAGQCTAQERAQVEAWYAGLEAEALLASRQEAASIRKVEKNLKDALAEERSSRRLRLLPVQAMLRVAAILVLAVTAALSYYKYKAADQRSPNPTEIIAHNGERKELYLKDGSVVYLNAGSRLVILPDFGQSSREVFLTGEAFFKVASDSLRPFIVKTHAVTTRVLGTSFNVQAYENESTASVAVAGGKVSVAKERQMDGNFFEEKLLPGRQLTFSKADQRYTVSDTDVAQLSAWRHGLAYFDNESVDAIARKLERKYDLRIRVTGDDKPECRYTFRISDEPIEKVLEILSRVAGITYTIQPDTILISTEACSNITPNGK